MRRPLRLVIVVLCPVGRPARRLFLANVGDPDARSALLAMFVVVPLGVRVVCYTIAKSVQGEPIRHL